MRDSYRQTNILLEYLKALHDTKQERLISEGHNNLANYWDVVSKLYAVNGLLTPLFLLPTEEYNALELTVLDLITYQVSKWDSDVRRVNESKRTKFGKEDVVKIMKEVGEGLIQNYQGLSQMIGEEKLSNIIERNRRILSGIAMRETRFREMLHS